jgi:hypothetical protein
MDQIKELKSQITGLEKEKKIYIESFLKTLEPTAENEISNNQIEESKKDENYCGPRQNFIKKKRKKLGKIYQDMISKRENHHDQKKKLI